MKGASQGLKPGGVASCWGAVGREERGQGSPEAASQSQRPAAQGTGCANREGCVCARVGVARAQGSARVRKHVGGEASGPSPNPEGCVRVLRELGLRREAPNGWYGKEGGGSDGSSRDVRAGAEAWRPRSEMEGRNEGGRSVQGAGREAGGARSREASPNPRGVRGAGVTPVDPWGRIHRRSGVGERGIARQHRRGKGREGGEAIKERSSGPPG